MHMSGISIRLGVLTIFTLLFLGVIFVLNKPHHPSNTPDSSRASPTNPLSIIAMRQKSYPGSELKIEEMLQDGSNYKQFIASYQSEGLKIYGLLTVPTTEMPKGGYPAIIFNHGYIPPEEYKTTERYVAYVDALATAGFVVFKPDYRGHGKSEGSPEGTYFSPAYTTDVLNALSSVKKLPYVNANKIGMWGHSMGGNIIQRALVVNSQDIKVAVIWGGAVGSYQDLFTDWWSKRRPRSFTPSSRELQTNRPTRQKLIDMYGNPSDKIPFWSSISPSSYYKNITAPVQLHHGLSDEEVPPSLSETFYKDLKELGKKVELYEYEGADHNISQSFDLAMGRSVDFFNQFLR